MQKLNPFKIYFIALLYTILPRKVRSIFYVKRTPIEHLAIGTAMTKIWHWRHFIRKHKKDNRLYFKLFKYPQ
jgi:hypothetical protein